MADEATLRDKTILITGGTGSLGQEVAKAVLAHNPASVRILSRNEYYQFEMKRKFNCDKLRFLIGDIRDRDRMYRASNNCDIIIHTAALKHVSFCEYNPIEAVKTNILGAVNIIDAAIDNGVGKVLAISSDKAVRPINLYGSTKLVMEKLFIDANVYGGKFSCVRFGNFIGSKGSLVDILQSQPDTIEVPDENMTRYWITLGEAALFTIKSLLMMNGGEIFIPKMTEESVTQVISRVSPNSKVKVTGVRMPEKICEDLLSPYEQTVAEEREDCWILSQR